MPSDRLLDSAGHALDCGQVTGHLSGVGGHHDKAECRLRRALLVQDRYGDGARASPDFFEGRGVTLLADGCQLLEQPRGVDVGTFCRRGEASTHVGVAQPRLFIGQEDLAHRRRMQRQSTTHARGTRDPLGAVDAVDV